MKTPTAEPVLRILVASSRNDLTQALAVLQAREPIEIGGRAATTKEALGSARIVRPDLVLAELEAEGLDGIELAARLAEDQPDVVTVIVSGRTDSDAVRGAMAAGAREFVTRPIDPEALGEVLRRAGRRLANRRRLLQEETPKGLPGAGLWAFVQPTSGNGQTTLMLSLANELLLLRRKVIVVDLERMFGDVGFYLGLHAKGGNLSDLIRSGRLDEDQALEASLAVHPSGLKVLLPPEDAAEAFACEPAQMVAVVEALGRIADYVLVDMPAGVHEGLLPLLDHARYLFVGCNGKLASFKNFRKLLLLFRRIGYPAKATLPVLTGYRPDEAPLRDFEDLLKKADIELGGVFPYDRESVQMAVRQGQPVSRVAPESEWTQRVRDFLYPLLELPPPKPVKGSMVERARKLFQKVFLA